MQPVKVLLLVALSVASVSGSRRLFCFTRHECEQLYRSLGPADPPLVCDDRPGRLICWTGVRAGRQSVSVNTPTVPVNTPTEPAVEESPAAPAVVDSPAAPALAPRASLPAGAVVDPFHLQNLQGGSNLGRRFGSRLQSQGALAVQGLQALAARRGGSQAAPAPPVLDNRGGFFRGHQ